MAPVKRAAAVAQRETRSTRSSVVAKKNAAAAEKKAVSPVAKPQSKSTGGSTAARVGRKTTRAAAGEVEDDAQEDAKNSQPTKPTRGRATRAVAMKPTPTTTLGAAPRRRIKVTPLNPSEQTAEDTEVSQADRKEPVTTKKSSTRTRKVIDQVSEESEGLPAADMKNPAPTSTRSTRKAVPQAQEASAPKIVSAPVRGRGRPKKTTQTGAAQPEIVAAAPAPMVRATRSHRAGSTATQQSELADPVAESRSMKSNGGVRKKVTFQDLPQDDKENQPVPSGKAKKALTSRTSSKTSTAVGLRAKPVRKAAVTGGITKTKRTTTSAKSKGTGLVTDDMTTPISRVLTPKKITQVAKAIARDEDDEGVSEDEDDDELNSGKTPVRDLSMSPRRPLTSKLAQAISPKKLTFNQSLTTAPQAKESDDGVNPEARHLTMASPARRPPTSPFKDGLKDSPKRGMGDSTRLLFPSQPRDQTEGGASIALNPANIASASQNMTTLLQSPKRSGVLDPHFFSQSAMKQSTSKSTFKSSLLASPAKRLFSPKKSADRLAPKISEYAVDVDDVFDDEAHSPLHEVIISSNFRASVSPVRVHRVELERSDMDFDESMLEVRSPLKVYKSPVRAKMSEGHVTHEDHAIVQTSTSPVVVGKLNAEGLAETSKDGPTVDPSNLGVIEESDAGSGGDLESELDSEAIDAQEPTEADHSVLSEAHDLSPRVSQALEQTMAPTAPGDEPREEQESSEDELAADETPLRSFTKSRAGLTNLSRTSLGVTQSAAGKGYGFTPLAAQISGWQASSPQKTPARTTNLQRHRSFEFSPVAGQHIEGEVVISRDSTPVQKLDKRQSLAAISKVKARASLGLRKSLAQRQSILNVTVDPSLADESPAQNPRFEEYMDLRDDEEEAASAEQDESNIQLGGTNAEFAEIMNIDGTEDNVSDQDEDETILVHELLDQDQSVQNPDAELTTDLIHSMNASDTAMIDFQKLAEEAEELASTEEQEDASVLPPAASSALECASSGATLTSSDEIYADENTEPEEGSRMTDELENLIEHYPLPEKAPSPDLGPSLAQAESPSILNIGCISSPSVDQAHELEPTEILVQATVATTPMRPNSQFSNPRVFNTVVSKVPLRPEGQVSPIKIHKKRARSFGNADEIPAKRLSLGSLKQMPRNLESKAKQSPDRQLRTSVAPSPGGTSTPASRYGRSSMGGMSAVTTPGQTSFAIDDFGDSTLDGIEIPDDSMFDVTSRIGNEMSSPAMSERTFGLASMMATPKAAHQTTSTSAKRSVRRVTAPASVVTTPATIKKTPSRNSATTASHRTPLQPVGGGVLDGATVFVDVHTSEGADASGIFTELLTQMGARCVKEWRWNPRASLAGREAHDQNIGITHVVYKDGGKRTLEKVRDAKGEVWCVGVAWVLDCERESKWLDEAAYTVDTSLAPRGGSRRRKSMEPRALLVANNGSISASKPRRSVSTEMSEMMKRELVNTPVRGRPSPVNQGHSDDEDEDNDSDAEHQEAATPTGFISYDPRTAMTPGTPYLVGEGKKLVQMSAPPKQTGKRLFEDNNDENEETFDDENARDLDSDRSIRDAKKFRMKNLDMKSRRRTLGFKPVVGSPLSRI